MPYSDRTPDFKERVQEKENGIPESRRRKRTTNGAQHADQVLGGGYVAEAYNILNHITTLTRMLSSIRKPYLDVNSRNTPLSRQSSRNINLDGTESSWMNIRQLTNEERDQIDLQARTILSRCADRVKEMEIIEKRRSELVASKVNPLIRLLPSRLRQDTSSVSSDFLAAHHSSITWYLSRRLTEASQSQKEMQEERVKRQMERTRTLGSAAAGMALNASYVDPLPPPEQAGTSGGGGWLGGASSSLIAATIGAPLPTDSYRSSLAPPINKIIEAPVSSDDEDDEIELSESQILQFETENADMLRTVQDTLESVQQAESRLMDISALQMELVSHLTKQTELTDQLYEDAIATTSMVDMGNTQLKEAKRRSKDGRLFILVFLIGASLSLLFLHYY